MFLLSLKTFCEEDRGLPIRKESFNIRETVVDVLNNKNENEPVFTHQALF